MSYTLENYLKILTPYLDSKLVSSQALSRIFALSEVLPSFSYGVLESYLGTEQSRVDFALRYFSENRLDRFNTDSPWRSLENFDREWAKPQSFLNQKVTDTWLEFDLDEQSSQISIPGIFLTLSKQVREDIPSLTQQVLRLLNRSIPHFLESNLELCVKCLPPSASFLHIGVMLSRPYQAVRLDVAGLELYQLLDYLQAIGWIDRTNTLRSLIADLSNFVDRIHLAFDVGNTVLPRIGLECFLEQQPKYEPRWQLFLDYLVKQELCTQAQQNALLAWSGFSQMKPEFSNRNWNNYLLGNKAFSILGRSISHIKIVVRADLSWEAKAYLAFAQRWFDKNLLPQAEVIQNV